MKNLPPRMLLTEESVASRIAKKLGLKSLGFGYWFKPPTKKAVAKTSDDGKKLIPVKKAVEPTGKKSAPIAPKATKAPTNSKKFQPINPAAAPEVHPGIIGPDDFKDAPDIKAAKLHSNALKLQARKIGKPTRRRAPGSITPGGDSELKQAVLKKGYQKGLAAPGNAGSALNEIMTGEAMHRILENPQLLKDEAGLALRLYTEYHKTGLAKQNSTGPKIIKNKDKRLEGLNRELYAKLLSTARAGIAETKRIAQGLHKVKWGASQCEFHHFYGHEKSKTAMISQIERAKKFKKNIYTTEGVLVDVDDLIKLTKSGGGGENPSDTAFLVRHKSGNLMVGFTSNKLTTADIQANSTPTFELREYAKHIEQLGYKDSVKAQIISLIENAQKEIAEIESGLGNSATPIINHLLHTSPNDLRKIIAAMHMEKTGRQRGADPNRQKRYKKFVEDRFSLKNMSKAKTSGGLSKESSYLREVMKQANPSWSGGEPTEPQKMRAFLNHVSRGKAAEAELKLISRAAADVSSIPTGEAAINEIRTKAIDAEFKLVKKLNTHKSPQGIPLGTYLEAQKIDERMHLQPGFEDVSKSGAFKYNGLLKVNMGGTIVGAKQLKHCLGGDSKQKFNKDFRVGKPEYTRDAKGNVSGSKSVVYRLDRQGKEFPIAIRSLRSKQGTTGKLMSVYFWHKNMQNCFGENQ